VNTLQGARSLKESSSERVLNKSVVVVVVAAVAVQGVGSEHTHG
jgi:hypothetical protein